ncbi:MAG: S49 family peptidase [Rhodospirillaceae bacterium]|nr:S49 family peptidase [Rhodospirillaceae bacterium]MDD9914522.1 S49 family peptidase [Rhodospirillaceae bacterium]
MTEKKTTKWLRRIPVAGEKIADRVEGGPLVNVLRLDGVVGRASGPRRGGMALSDMAESIEKAFKGPQLSAVALAINSPGGSPVQSALIATRIRALAAENEVPVYAFCEDVAASGGYWLACAADEIYADPASIVGSIGVVFAGFGFPEMLAKIGVERRVHTAGEKKAILDPFKSEDQEDVEILKELQADIHEQFKDHVRERRGDKLQADESVLFSGEFWTGNRALGLGLVDGLGDLRSVMRERYGEKVKLKVVGRRRGWLEKRLGMRNDWADELIGAVESRALWSRYGL